MFRRAPAHGSLRRAPQACHYSSRILAITDVEGCGKAFFPAVKNSSVVTYHPDRGLNFNKSIARPYFIYGGDATDRGNHDLEITHLLVNFKKRHPGNVFLLAGNRDIKNNRFKIELDPRFIRERLQYGAPPRWLPAEQRTVPLDYLMMDMEKNRQPYSARDTVAISQYLKSISDDKCQLIYLRWMLEKTMGSPHAFRYRREEMAKFQPNKKISDEDVLHNFLRETAPDGLMGQYLQLAQVGVIIPDTGVIAVHGGLTDFNIGRIPGMKESEPPIEDARRWLQEFNHWYDQQIRDWVKLEPAKMMETAYTALDESVLPIPGKKKSVITSDMLGENRRFVSIHPDVSRFMKKNGLRILHTGHQPCTDKPILLRDNDNGVIAVNGDTGRAFHDPNNPDDTRGQASHVLEISASKDRTLLNIRATLADGTPVNTELLVTNNGIEGDDYIGRLLPDGRLVQCQLSDGHYRLAEQCGIKVTYSVAEKAELEKLLNPAKVSVLKV